MTWLVFSLVMTQRMPLTQWVGSQGQGFRGKANCWLNISQMCSLLHQHKVSSVEWREANVSVVNATKFVCRDTGTPTSRESFMVLEVNTVKTELLILPLSTQSFRCKLEPFWIPLFSLHPTFNSSAPYIQLL